jgi:hypothetical protein
MDQYVGCKIVSAEPMDECTFLRTEKNENVDTVNGSVSIRHGKGL